MDIIQITLLMLVILLAFPAGLLLAKATKEELREGRRAFVSIILVSLAVVLVFLFLNFSNEQKIVLVLSMMIIAIISFISLEKSYKDAKVVNKKNLKSKEARKGINNKTKRKVKRR